MILQTCEFKIRSFDITYQKQKRRITPIREISIALGKVWESLSTQKKCWNSGGLTTWTLPIFRVKYTASEFGKHTSFTLQGDAHYTNLLKKTKKWVEN